MNRRLAEYFVVSRVAKHPVQRGPSVDEENGTAALDPAFVTAREKYEKKRRAKVESQQQRLRRPQASSIAHDDEQLILKNSGDINHNEKTATANNNNNSASNVDTRVGLRNQEDKGEVGDKNSVLSQEHQFGRASRSSSVSSLPRPTSALGSTSPVPGVVGRRTSGHSRREPPNPELFAQARPTGDEDPIVDICVIFPNQREKIPSGFRCLVRTPFGYRGDCNSGVVGSEGVFICIKHSSSHKPTTGKPLLPIVDVKVIFLDKEPVPAGYELISRSRSGALPANLNYGYLGQTIFLAVKRMPTEVSSDERYHALQPLVDVCIINASKNESVPRGYEVIPKSTSEGNWTGNKMYVCIRRGRAFGMLDQSFAATLTERVPRTDRPGFPISDEMALLTAPGGLKCQRRVETNVPIPKFFSFVMTKEDGSQIHASCLTFYEVLDDETVDYLERSYDAYLRIMSDFPKDPMVIRQLKASAAANRCDLVRTDAKGRPRGYTAVKFHSSDNLDGFVVPQSDNESPAPETSTERTKTDSGRRLFKTCSSSSRRIYCPIVLCILSHFPFYREFKQFLMLLYQVSISSTVIPIERYVAQLIYELPVPRPGSAGFELQFGAGHRGIRFSLPPEGGLPITSVNYETVFRCLGPPEFVQLFTLMLLEKKIILHSKYVSVLNQVAEATRSLMFPLNWQNIYIPVCPNNLAHFLAAPRSFVIGLHTDAFDLVQLSAPEQGDEGWWEIALDEGKIYYLDVLERATSTPISQLLATPPGGDEIDPIRVVRTNIAPPSLPTSVLNGMLKRLRSSVLSRAPSLEDEIGKGATRVLGQQNPDMAYSLTPLEARGEDALRGLQFAVRDAALHAMVELIGTYRDYLLPPRLASRGLSRAEVLPTNLADIFNVDGFLHSLPKATRAFTEQLTKTLHFTKFVDERTFSTDLSYRFLFFDAFIAATSRKSSFTSSFKSSAKSPEQTTHSMLGRTTSEAASSRPNSASRSPTFGFASSGTLHRPSSSMTAFPGGTMGMYQSQSSSTKASSFSSKRSTDIDNDLLILRVLEETTGKPAIGSDEDVLLLDGGGGEIAFSNLCLEQNHNFVLNYNNWNVENPWKERYVYHNFPSLFDDTLLMAHLVSGSANDRRRSTGRSPAIDMIESSAPVVRVRARASSTPYSSSTIGTGTLELMRNGTAENTNATRRNENIWGGGEEGTHSSSTTDLNIDGSTGRPSINRSAAISARALRAPKPRLGSSASSDEDAEDRARSFTECSDDSFDPSTNRAASADNAEPEYLGLPAPPSMRSDRMARQMQDSTSTSDRTVRAGCRLGEELNRSNLEQQFAFSEPTTGMPRARACYVETLGAILALAPALLTSRYARPRFAMSLILGALTYLARRHGHVLDEAATRAVLAGCALSGPGFALDANNAFHSLVEHGCKPNAVTYGFFTMALALRQSNHAKTRRAVTTWKRLVKFLWAYLAMRNPGSRLAPLYSGPNSPPLHDQASDKGKGPSASKKGGPAVTFVALWTGTRCPDCKARLLDEHIMQGWEVDINQLAQSCVYCNFLVVPRIEYRVLRVTATDIVEKDHGQCEYMSPIVLRRQAEYMVDALAEKRTLRLSRTELRRTNPALYYNILWYAKRINAPVLFAGEQYDATMTSQISGAVRTVVSCTWQRFPIRDVALVRQAIANAGADWIMEPREDLVHDPFITGMPTRSDSGSYVRPRRGSSLFERGVLSTKTSAAVASSSDSPHSAMSPLGDSPGVGRPVSPRRLQKHAASTWMEPVNPNVYMVRELLTSNQIREDSLWGNRSVSQMLHDQTLLRSLPEETFYVTPHSTPLGVVAKLSNYLDSGELARAVRLFLSARMASRGRQDGEGYVEKDGRFLRRGWELFNEAVYIELCALSRMGQRQMPVSRIELELERSLAKVLRSLEHVDPTLASCMDKRDFPPTMRSLAFRNFFAPLYP